MSKYIKINYAPTEHFITFNTVYDKNGAFQFWTLYDNLKLTLVAELYEDR